MFVTSSNFDILPYNLPNLDKVSFPEYVDQVEEEALLKLLGRQLYKSFIDGLEGLEDIAEYDEATATEVDTQYIYGNDIWKALTVTTGVFPVAGVNWELVEEANKWLELKNGAEYEYTSKTWKWIGMAKLLTPFVYSRWVRDNVDSFSGNGVVVPNNENSQLISPIHRISRAHNDYAEKVGVLRGFAGAYLRGSYRWDQYFSYEDTLMGFLTAKGEGVYEGWTFESPGLMNIANI